MITRRRFMGGAGVAATAAFGLGGYAVAVEPGFRLQRTRYRLTPPGWPPGFKLRIAALADLHACEPWMNVDRIRRIVAKTNRYEPDVTLLLGDYEAGMAIRTADVPSAAWAGALSGLRARRGVFAVMGNHDWGRDAISRFAGDHRPAAWRALERAGIQVLENDAVRVTSHGRGVWIAGLGDQLAPSPGGVGRGRDDLAKTVAALGSDEEPAILMAHEPDIFPRVPRRFALTLAGHTHGGQVRFLGKAPLVPSRYGDRFAYGHIEDAGRHMIVSGGLGCSNLPIRFGVPPEVVIIELGGDGPEAPADPADGEDGSPPALFV
ncbi:MAG: metallophosphoesterase [Pseudomonadota bacterium]